ncbi:MAG: HAD family phosphatase [Lachnospiraceae bacterium]|nr:HAD family phosphatase [Lachnospiraceae bacterium]
MLQNKKALIFDLDGSLADSMWMWKQIDIEYLARFNLDNPSDLQSSIEGMSFTEVAVYFKDRFHIDRSIEDIKADWIEMAWTKYRDVVTLKPGARSLLDHCRENGIKLGIGTSNSRELVEMFLDQRGVRSYFDCIMTACDVEKGKPAPDIYLKVAEELDVDPKDCLVFEDLVLGIAAAKDAGMEVCAVEDDYSVYQRDEKIRTADYYINDFVGIA